MPFTPRRHHLPAIVACRRVSHSSFQPGGVLPVAPSAVPIADLKTGTADGKSVPYETPRALETSEIPGIVEPIGRAQERACRRF